MANRERGEAVLLIGEDRFVMRVTTNACVEAETLSGRAWDQIVGHLVAGSLRDGRLLLWACLRDHYPTVATCDADGLARVGDLIDRLGGVQGEGFRQVVAFLQFNADPGVREEGTGQAPARKRGWHDLIVDALVLGFSLEEFWGLSLRELWAVRDAAARKQREAQQERVSLAWWTASLMRQEKIPSLARLLRGNAPQSGAELAQAVQQIGVLYGLPVHITKKES